MLYNESMKRFWVFFIVGVFLTGSLFFVNRDLFRYTYDSACKRSFTPEIAEKGDYLVSKTITLKPGSYLFFPEISVQGPGSGIYISDSGGEELFAEELGSDALDPVYPFEITGGTKRVRIGIRYEPAYSRVDLKRIRISSDHVLYRESLTKHFTESLILFLLAGWMVLRFAYPDTLFRLCPLIGNRQNEIALWVILGSTLVSAYPLFNTKVYVDGQDMFFHLCRIQGLAESFHAGYFPVRDQLFWLNNYGYGTGFFYPDVFLYFPALMVLLGFELLTSYKVFLILCSFFAIGTTYAAAYKISGSRIGGTTAAVLMAFSAYRLSNLYYRGAVGETQATVFYPLIIWGLYEIFYGDKRKWGLFALGFWGMLSCHMISLMIAGCITAVFILFRIRLVWNNKTILTALLKSFLVVVCLGAFFLLPMLEQTLTNPNLRINKLLETGAGPINSNYAIPIKNLLVRFAPWNGMLQANAVFPGWAFLMIPVLRLMIVGKKCGKRIRQADTMLIYSLVLLWMSTRAFPWQYFMWFVNRVQFAYRLLLPASVLAALAGGIYFTRLISGEKPIQWLFLLSLFCFFTTAFPILKESVEHRSNPKSEFVMQDNRVSGAEYMPARLLTDFPDKNRDTVFTEDPEEPYLITAHDRRKLGFTFSYEAPEGADEVFFSIPLIYYTGFQGTLEDEKGNCFPLKISWDSIGLVQVSNQALSRGTISVHFEKTTAARIGECVSLLTICFLLFWKKKRPHEDLM